MSGALRPGLDLRLCAASSRCCTHGACKVRVSVPGKMESYTVSPSAAVPAEPVDATLYPRWKDGVYSAFRREPIVGVLTSPSKQAVRQLNERPRKALGIETPAERFNASGASTG